MEDPVLQSPTNPHFFQPLLTGYHSHLIIPVTFFSKHMNGKSENKTARLRSDASDRTWEVEIDHGRRLTGGWKEFVTAHDLRVGDVLVFRLVGDLVFHVTPLRPSCCEIEYTPAHDHEDKIASEIRPMKKRAKKNPRREEDFSTDHSCFVANVSVASMRDDKLYVPVGFVMSNRLRETNCKIVLLNEMGRSWNLTLYNDKSGTYLRHEEQWDEQRSLYIQTGPNFSNSCKMVQTPFKVDGLGFVFPIGSPLVADISRAILKVEESNKAIQLENAWFKNIDESCPDPLTNPDPNPTVSFRQLGIDSFWVLFLAAAIVCALALGIFVFYLLKEDPDRRNLRELWQRFFQPDQNSYIDKATRSKCFSLLRPRHARE